MEAHPRARRWPEPPRHPRLASAQPPAVASARSAPRTESSQAALEAAPLTAAEPHYLNEGELARRWGLSPKTLQRWRGEGIGPVFVKFSRRVAYPLEGSGGILDLEQRSRYRSTNERVTEGDRQ